MSTNASISIKVENKIKTIYQHWDGYPDWTGKKLLKFYDTEEKVKELIDLGNISILGESIGSKTDFDKFDSRLSIQCLAYGRDRGEPNQNAREYDKFSDKEEQEWNYLFKDGKWFMAKGSGRWTVMTNEKCNDKY